MGTIVAKERSGKINRGKGSWLTEELENRSKFRSSLSLELYSTRITVGTTEHESSRIEVRYPRTAHTQVHVNYGSHQSQVASGLHWRLRYGGRKLVRPLASGPRISQNTSTRGSPAEVVAPSFKSPTRLTGHSSRFVVTGIVDPVTP